MEYIQLGVTDLNISRIGFGAEPLGGTDWGKVDIEQAQNAVRRAVDLGINIFDTADVYGLGRSEELLADALGSNRHTVTIATKFGVNWSPPQPGTRAKTFFDSSPQHVVQALEASLRRLRVDTIPLYFVHWPDPSTPLHATLDTLKSCQQAGKVMHIGLSNMSAEQIAAAHAIVPIAAVQLPYNLIDRRAESSLLATCRSLNISVFAYGSLAQGLLTGKYDAASRFGNDDRRHRLPHFQPDQHTRNRNVVNRLQQISQPYTKSPAQIALRWVLDNPAIACALVGAKTTAQVEQNVGAAGWKLSPTDHAALTADTPSSSKLAHLSD